MMKARKIAQDELNKSLAEQAIQLATDKQCLLDYEMEVSQGAVSTEDFKRLMDGASTSAKEHALATKGVAGSTDVFVAKQEQAQESLKATATASRGATIAMQALATVGNMFVSWAISEALSLAINAISDYINRLEISKEKLAETESELDSVDSELKDITSKIKELESLGTPSLTDKEDLERLRAENKELAIRKKYLEDQKKLESEDVVQYAKEKMDYNYGRSTSRESIDAYKAYMDNPEVSNSETDTITIKIAQYERYQELRKQALERGNKEDLETIDLLDTKLKQLEESLLADRKELQGFKDDLSLTGESSPELDNITNKLEFIDNLLLAPSENLKNFLNSDEIAKDIENLKELASSGELTENQFRKSFPAINSYLEENGLSFQDLISVLEIYKDELEGLADVSEHLNNWNIQGFSDTIKSYEEGYSKLVDAQEEWNESKSISAETFADLQEDGLLEYIETTSEGLVINTDKLLENAQASKDKAVADLHAAMMSDMLKIALGDVDGISEEAKTVIAELGNNTEEAGNQALSSVANWATLGATITDTMARARGEDRGFNGISNEQKSQMEAVYGYYTDLAKKVSAIDIKLPTKTNASSAGKKAGKEYKEALEKELSDLDKVLGFITDTIQDQIDAWKDAKDAAVDALEAQRDAAVEALEAQKEAVQAQIDAKQDEIDKIKEAREERQSEIDLQKKQYDLARMQNQQTQFIYKNGQMVYETDTAGIRDALESVAEAKENIKILQIEKEISNLEDVIDSLDRQIDSINDHYDKLIKQTEAYYDALIKGMEEYKSRWEELGEIEEQAKINVMLEELGITTDDVLNMSGEAFEQFKKRYLDILTEMHKGESDMVAAINEVADGIDTEKLSEGLDKTKENIDKLTDTDYSTVVNGVSNISNALNEVPSSDKYESLTNSFNLLAEAIQNVAIALGITGDESISSLVTALSSLSTLSLGDEKTGIIAQFNALKTAVDEVTSSISGGASKANESGGLTTGANGGSATPNGESQSGLTGAITEIGTTTNETLGTADSEGGESEEGDGVLGKFSKFKTAVDEVTKAIGTGEEESNEESTSLISALQKHYETAEETLPQVKSFFEELLVSITACVNKLNELGNGISSLGNGGIPVEPNAKGTSYAKKGLHLVGEEAPELIEDTKGNLSLATQPTLLNMEGGEKVYNGEETEELLNPLEEIDPIYAMHLKAKAYYEQHPELLFPTHNIMSSQMQKNIDSLKNMNVVNNNKSNSYNVGDVHIHCSGITSKDVAEQAAMEFNRQIFGMSNEARQRASITR